MPGRRSARTCSATASSTWRATYANSAVVGSDDRVRRSASAAVRSASRPQHGGEGVGGAGRVDDQPGIGPDRRLRDGDGQLVAVAVEDGAAVGGQGGGADALALARRAEARPPRPSAAGRRARAGGRTRRARRPAPPPGGDGCDRRRRAQPLGDGLADAAGSRGPGGDGRRVSRARVVESVPVEARALRRRPGSPRERPAHGARPVISLTSPHSGGQRRCPRRCRPTAWPVAAATWSTTSAVGVRYSGAVAGTMPSRSVAVGTM